MRRGEVGGKQRMALALANYWQVRGPLAEGRGHLERILAARDLAPDRRAKLTGFAGVFATMPGDLPAARRYMEAAPALRREGQRMSAEEALAPARQEW